VTKSRKNSPKNLTIFGSKGLLKMFGIPDADTLIEANQDYIDESAAAASKSVYEKETEEGNEARYFAAQEDAEAEIYRAWQKSFEEVLAKIAEDTGVALIPDWKNDSFKVESADWSKAANKIRQIISGVGLTYAGDTNKEAREIESVSTPRQYVLKLWPVVRDYPDVWGTNSYARVYQRALESNMGNL